MGLIVAALFFIFASIGAACDGDYSGLAAIAKFVLFIVLFIVIGTILTNPALLTIAIVVIVLVVIGKCIQ